MKRDPVERFWSKVDRRGPSDCWVWAGGTFWFGHGRFSLGRKTVMAHRFAYELLVGPIPEGLVLDHLCSNPPCVNPAHLEPVTSSENVRRGRGATAMREKTHCPQGHPYDEQNTYRRPSGGRICRECSRAAGRRFVDKRRGGPSKRPPYAPPQRVLEDPDDYRHGTRTGYGYGCRCEPCCEAARADARAQYWRKRKPQA